MEDPSPKFGQPALPQAGNGPSQAPTLTFPSSSTINHTVSSGLNTHLLSAVNEKILEDCSGNIPGYAPTIRAELLHLQEKHGELIEAIDTPDGEVQYRCRVCGHPSNKPSQRRWEMSPHVLTHARIPLRPWKCSCGRSYLRSHDRKRHSDKCPMEHANIAQPFSVPYASTSLGPQPGMSRLTNRHHPYSQLTGNARSSVGVGHIPFSDQNPSQDASYSSPRSSSAGYLVPAGTSVHPLQNMLYPVIPGQPVSSNRFDHYSTEHYASEPSALPASYSMPFGHGYATTGFMGGPRMGPFNPSLQPPDYSDVVPNRASSGIDTSMLWPKNTGEYRTDPTNREQGISASQLPKSTDQRQHLPACSACRYRRVKCDLKDLSADANPNAEVSCTNCKERGIRCNDGYAESKKELRRKGKSFNQLELEGHSPINVDGSLKDQSPTYIPILQPEFFDSPFYRDFQVQHPIIDTVNFHSRYVAWFQRRPSSKSQSTLFPAASPLSMEGQLLAKLLVVWAAAIGVDESGIEQPGNSYQDVQKRRFRVKGMAEEVIRIIDNIGLVRKPSWDGVCCLFMALPLIEDPVDRLSIHKAVVKQVYTLFQRDGIVMGISPESRVTHALNRARAFWYAYVQEGLTTGLQGGRLLMGDEDLKEFRQELSLASTFTENQIAVQSSDRAYSLAFQYVAIPIRLAFACRKVHAALTGPKAKLGKILDDKKLGEMWEALALCWEELEGLRYIQQTGYVSGEDATRFVDRWQISLFECYNVIQERIRNRLDTARAAQITELDENTNSSATIKALVHDLGKYLAIAEAKCFDVLDHVVQIIRRHLGSSFFAYDTSPVQDGCFFAGHTLALMLDRDEDVKVCLQALSEMRWAFSKGHECSQTIKLAWKSRSASLPQNNKRSLDSELIQTDDMYTPPSGNPPSNSSPMMTQSRASLPGSIHPPQQQREHVLSPVSSLWSYVEDSRSSAYQPDSLRTSHSQPPEESRPLQMEMDMDSSMPFGIDDTINLLRSIERLLEGASPKTRTFKATCRVMILVYEIVKACEMDTKNYKKWEELAMTISAKTQIITEMLRWSGSSETRLPLVMKRVSQLKVSLDNIIDDISIQVVVKPNRSRSPHTLFHKMERHTQEAAIYAVTADKLWTYTSELQNLFLGSVRHLEDEADSSGSMELMDISDANQTPLLQGLNPKQAASGELNDFVLEGTFQSLLNEITDWASDEAGPQLFWLIDAVGTGKSTIANTLVRKWNEQEQLAGCYFFLNSTSEAHTAIHFFNTVAQFGICHLNDHIQAAVARGIGQLNNYPTTSIKERFRILFSEPLQKMDKQAILVLDAMDECEEASRNIILSLILPELLDIPLLKVIVTSRPIIGLDIFFDQARHIRGSLLNEHQSGIHDVEKYLHAVLRGVLRVEHISRLSKRSNGHFLWASIASKTILNSGQYAEDMVELLMHEAYDELEFLNRLGDSSNKRWYGLGRVVSVLRKATLFKDIPEISGARILVLNGEGSQAHTLLDMVGAITSRSSLYDPEILPCEEFDMIIGCGIGGMLALFLGALRMSTKEAREAFLQLCPVHTDSRAMPKQERLEIVDEAIDALLTQRGLSLHEKLRAASTSEPSCRVSVLLSYTIQANQTVFIRNFCGRTRTSLESTLAQALRATCMSADLGPTMIGPPRREQKLTRSEVSHGTVVVKVLEEVSSTFPADRFIECITCITDNIDDASNVQLPRYIPFQNIQVKSSISQQDALYRHAGPSKHISMSRIRDIDPALFQRKTNRELLPSVISPHVWREQEMRELIEYTLEAPGDAQRIVVISGALGTGKTQLIASFVMRFQQNFSIILYVDGSTKNSLMESIITAMQRIDYKCSTIEDARGILLSWNEVSEGRWLLVIDNLNTDASHVFAILPRCDHGTILLLTRSYHIGHISPSAHLMLGELASEQAVELLVKLAAESGNPVDNSQRRAAFCIVEYLGNHPGAISDAASQLPLHGSLHSYLCSLRADRFNLSQSRSPDGKISNTYNAIKSLYQQLTTDSQQFLFLVACGPRTEFSLSMLEATVFGHFRSKNRDLEEQTQHTGIPFLDRILQLDDQSSSLHIDDIISELQSHSFISYRAGPDGLLLSVHPLIHRIAHNALSPLEQQIYTSAYARIISSGLELLDDIGELQPLVPQLLVLLHSWECLSIDCQACLIDLLGKLQSFITEPLWIELHETIKSHFGEGSLQSNRLASRTRSPHPIRTNTDGSRPRPGETSGGKKRHSRATQEQLDILNGVYARTPFPTTVERSELAQKLGMTPRSVQIWFQNKRQGAKKNESRRREQPPLISTQSNSPPDF